MAQPGSAEAPVRNLEVKNGIASAQGMSQLGFSEVSVL